MRNEIIKDMNINEYHKQENGLSNTGMGYLLDCPARYFTEYLDPNKPKTKEAEHFTIGKAVHSLVLEPDTFWLNNYIFPKCDRRTKIGKEDYEMHIGMSAGKNLIDDEQYAQIKGMAESLKRRIPWFVELLKEAHIEQSFFWQDETTGIQLKSRPDAYTDGMWFDLKTTRSVESRAYTRSIIEYGYHRQAALAREALRKLKGFDCQYFLHICIEESYPYLTKPFMISDSFLDLGDEQWREAAKTYKTCIERNEWPDYGSKVELIEPPYYLLNI